MTSIAQNELPFTHTYTHTYFNSLIYTGNDQKTKLEPDAL